MTTQQLANLAEKEADARFPEVIERLFFLLERRDIISKTPRLIQKWERTGLLESIFDDDKLDASFALETTALSLIDETSEGRTDVEFNEYVTKRFHLAIEPFLDQRCVYRG